MKIIERKNLLDAIASGSVYGIGASKNESNDYAKNVSLGVVGNVLGNSVGNQIYGRSGNALAKKITSQSVSSTFDTLFAKKRDGN